MIEKPPGDRNCILEQRCGTYKERGNKYGAQ